jgi:NADH-quinone oxidoreductase subunit J
MGGSLITIFLINFLGFLTICNAIMVIGCNNPINSLLFLISSFISTSFILMFFGLDFIALLYILIYVGAITIFFAFIIMALNFPTFVNNKMFLNENKVIFMLWLIISLFYEKFFLNAFLDFFFVQNLQLFSLNIFGLIYLDTLKTIAILLFTKYLFIVILLGIFLFFGLIGVLRLFLMRI